MSIYTADHNITDLDSDEFEKSYSGYALTTNTMFMCLTNIHQNDVLQVRFELYHGADVLRNSTQLTVQAPDASTLNSGMTRYQVENLQSTFELLQRNFRFYR